VISFVAKTSPFCFLFFNILKILEQHGQWNFLEFLFKKSPHFQGFFFFGKFQDFWRIWADYL